MACRAARGTWAAAPAATETRHTVHAAPSGNGYARRLPYAAGRRSGWGARNVLRHTGDRAREAADRVQTRMPLVRHTRQRTTHGTLHNVVY